MVWNKQKMKHIGTMMVMAVLMTACSISYQFNGSSIDYTKVKSIAIETFPNRSVGFVWGPMAEGFWDITSFSANKICSLSGSFTPQSSKNEAK